MTFFVLAVMGLGFAGQSSPVLPGDARQGKELFRIQKCVACHSVEGTGGKRAPDLAKRLGRGYTPAGMAALMWNHAPTMWAQMEQAVIPRPELTGQQAADLFSFFYAARYFDQPGDAARGRRVFEGKRCAECHGLASAVHPMAKPVSAWQELLDPIALAEQMWNHAAQMKPEMAKRKVAWPVFSSAELTDLMVYLQTLSRLKKWQAVAAPPEPAVASAQTGEKLFSAKGCQSCHTGRRSHVGRYTGRSLTDFAAAMWNHAPRMAEKPPVLSHGEMRHIIGYLWTLQVFDQPGKAARGRQVFTKKNCATCHDDRSSGAPDLVSWQGRAAPFAMVEALWQHGPKMLQMVQVKGIAWPRFESGEMVDLIAYLNASAPR